MARRPRKIRDFLWPRMGLRRLARYYGHRMGRLSGTPRAIAGGVAVGIAVSFTPFIGFHVLLGAGLCWLFRLSFIGMVMGTVVGGNPWTLPPIWLGTFRLGRWILSHEEGSHALPDAVTFSALVKDPAGLLWPMTVGSLPLALLFGGLGFYFSLRLVSSYKMRKRGKVAGGGRS